MEANNDNKVELKHAIFTNLFSTSMFQTDKEKSKLGNNNNKDQNLQFVKIAEDLEGEYSFVDALNFLKEFGEKKIGLMENIGIKMGVMLDKAKKFVGIGTEENSKLKYIFMKFNDKRNKESYSQVIKNIYELPKLAGKLDLLLNKKIESIAHADLMKISTEIKEAYLNFQNKIKETLDLINGIIDSVYEKRKFSEILEDVHNGKQKQLSQAELQDYNVFKIALQICRNAIESIKKDKIFLKENLELVFIYNSSLCCISDSIDKNRYDNINQDLIKRLIDISQFCTSYLKYKCFSDAKKAMPDKFSKNSSNNRKNSVQDYFDKQVDQAFGTVDTSKIEKFTSTIEKFTSINVDDCSTAEKIKLLDKFVDRFSFDSKQLLYKMIDDEIDITEEELRDAKLKESENINNNNNENELQLKKLKKNIDTLTTSCDNIRLEQKIYGEFKENCMRSLVVHIFFALVKNYLNIKQPQTLLNQLTQLMEDRNKTQNEIEQKEKEIQILNLLTELTGIKNSISQIKSQHEVYFWLCEKYESLAFKILIIGFLFGFIAWVMQKLSEDICNAESSFKNLETRKNNAATEIDQNKNILKKLGIKSDELNTPALNKIQNKINSLNEVNEKLENKKQTLDDKINKFLNDNKSVLEASQIDLNGLGGDKLMQVQVKLNGIIEPSKNKIEIYKKWIDQHKAIIKELKLDSNLIKNIEAIQKDIENEKQYNDGIKQTFYKYLVQSGGYMKEKYTQEIFKTFFGTDQSLNLASTVEDIEKCINNIEKQINDNDSKLQNINQKLNNLNNQYNELNKNKKNKMSNEPNNADDMCDIEELKLKIKKLKSPYTVIRALEQQAGILEANKYIFGTLNYKLLEAAKKNNKALKGKSVNELLSGENAIIKTNYISKNDLQKIKNQQTEEDKKKKGVFNVVLRYKDKFLKEGKIFISFDSKRPNLQLYWMGYFKGNSDVLIDDAYHNNIANEIASFFGFDVIIGSDVVVSDGNINILMMDNASKHNRRDGNHPLNENDANKLKNNKNELQKLWDSTSALAFLDIVMMQIDRNPGNYFYNKESVRGIDNDCFTPTPSIYNDCYQRDFKETDKIRKATGSFVYGDKNGNNGDIVAMALAKMPVISTDLKNKILKIDKNQFTVQLNLLFRNDINREDKINGILSRFNKLIELIDNKTIEAYEEIDDDIISKIEARNSIVYAELLLVTGKHYWYEVDLYPRQYDRYLYNNQFLSILNNVVNYFPDQSFFAKKNLKVHEISYHNNMLQKILNKKQSKDLKKPLLAENELEYIKELKKGINKMK